MPLAEDYLRRKPNDFEALYIMGAVDRGLGKYPEAEQMLSKAVALEPNHYDARYDLGFVLAKLGKPEEAGSNWKKRCRLIPVPAKRGSSSPPYCVP